MDVIVIGAGVSGLTAAAVLRRAGADIRVLEAEDRIGGRVQAVRDPQSGSVLGDLGPTWIWPKYQPVVARWLDALGISTFEQFNHGNAVLTGYAPQTIHQPLPGQDGMVRPVGGPSAFIDALRALAGEARITTDAAVVNVAETGSDGVRVSLASGDTLTSKAVVMAVPLRVAAARMDLPWAAPELLDALQRTPTWMAAHAKVSAIYERPFWRDVGLSGRLASQTEPLFEAHDNSGADGQSGAIFGFVGWPPARRLADPEALREGILAQLRAAFGREAGHPKQLVIEDWATRPWIATQWDREQPAAHPDIAPQILRQPHLGGRVCFAVSEASDISPGLIEGALARGERAALDVLGEIS